MANLNVRALAFFAPCVIGLALLLGFFMNPLIPWLLVICFFIGGFLVARPRGLLPLYWLWICLTPFLNDNIILNIYVRWADELLALVLVIVMLLSISMRKRGDAASKLPRPLSLGFLLFFVIAIISVVVNHSSITGVFGFSMGYLRPIILFLYAYMFYGARDSKPFIKVCFYILIIQLLLNAGWLLHINPLPNYHHYIDIAVGSFNSCSVVAYYCIAVIFVLAALWISRTQSRKVNRRCVLLVAICFVQVYFTFSMHSLVFFGLVSLLLPFIRLKYVKILIYGAILMGVLLMLMTAWEKATFDKSTTEILSSKQISARWRKFQYTALGMAYKDVMFNFAPEVHYPWLGAGPGKMGSSFAITKTAEPLSVQYFSYAYTSFDDTIRKQTSSIVGNPSCGFLAIWSELGPIAWFIYWGAHLYVAWCIWRWLKQGRLDDADPLFRALAEGLIVYMVFHVILNMITDTSPWQVLHGVWIWAGIVFAGVLKSRDEPKEVIL